ncbi:MAG: hypothetical protein JWO67_2051 [Streptosporangiaceae bacterium]|nr:hypothetical protein [Streptosporangiaceae bacterium]
MTAAKEMRTGYEAMDWLVRVNAPAWLDASGLAAEASSLRALPPLVSIDAIQESADRLREMQTVAYRRSGVPGWSEVDGLRAYGAMAAKNAAFGIVGYAHGRGDSQLVNSVAGYAWTVASYAAHAVADEQRTAVTADLSTSVPAGVVA